MRPRNSSKLALCLFFLAAFSTACGLLLIFSWPAFVEWVVSGKAVLGPHSHFYGMWKRFPARVPTNFYFFNWTNPEQVCRREVRPKFEQIGPYRYVELKEKDRVRWNANGTVTFRLLRTWFYDDGAENADVEENVTTVNPIALSAVFQSGSWNYLIRKGVSVSLSTLTRTVHMVRTARELLFDGYSEPLIQVASRLPLLNLEPIPLQDKFAWLYNRNGTSHYDGVYNMGTGSNSTTCGRLYEWNYARSTPYFDGNCAMINGSAGEIFERPPGKEKISFFFAELCRSLTFRYEEDVLVHGIPGNKYVLDEYVLDNGTLYPENKCFCRGPCVPSGVVNVTACRWGVPMFFSLPHFYRADEYYLRAVEGLKPEKSTHEMYMVLEQTTGLFLEVSVRLQINLLMQPAAGISLYEDVPRVFMPVVWFEQRFKLPQTEVFMLSMLLKLPVVCCSAGIALLFLGLIMLSYICYKAILCRNEKRDMLYREQNIPLKCDNKTGCTKGIS